MIGALVGNPALSFLSWQIWFLKSPKILWCFVNRIFWLFKHWISISESEVHYCSGFIFIFCRELCLWIQFWFCLYKRVSGCQTSRLLGGFSTTMTCCNMELTSRGFGGLISKAEVRFAIQFKWRNACHWVWQRDHGKLPHSHLSGLYTMGSIIINISQFSFPTSLLPTACQSCNLSHYAVSLLETFISRDWAL